MAIVGDLRVFGAFRPLPKNSSRLAFASSSSSASSSSKGRETLHVPRFTRNARLRARRIIGNLAVGNRSLESSREDRASIGVETTRAAIQSSQKVVAEPRRRVSSSRQARCI